MFRQTPTTPDASRPAGARLARARQRRAARRRTLETLEPRLLMAANPIGHVDSLSASSIAGWAFDATDGAAPVSIQVQVNGTDIRAGQSAFLANLRRDDLASFGSLYHGFAITLDPATIGPGSNAVAVYAQDSAGNRTLLKQQTLTDAAPIGHVDGITANAVYGWLFDADRSPVNYRIDIDGVAGTVQTANQPRNDLLNYLGRSDLGFSATGDYAGHTVEVYAIDSPSGKAVLMGSNNHPPIGTVDVANQQMLLGWAYDADFGTAAVNLRVDIDGVAGVLTGTANLQRPDLVSYLGSGAHGYQLTMPALTPGAHDVKIYVLDSHSSAAPETLLRDVTITNAAPLGHLDVNSDTLIAGWAYDSNAGAAAIDVSLYIDYQLYQTVAANQARPDLSGYLGSANHGFSFDVSSIPALSHSVTITMHDSSHAANDEVVLYDEFVHNSPPVGTLDGVASNAVYGWAFDPDMGAGAINVDLYVDDVYISTTSANQTRNDLSGYLGSPNHGYSIALPTLSFGNHRIDIYAAESQGLVSQRIGTRTVTNMAPIGRLDTLAGGFAYGWAADFSDPNAAVQVKLVVDGVALDPVSANLLRSDLVNFAGNGLHGYKSALPTLGAGLHEITAYAIDLTNGSSVVLGTRLLTV
jgi:hypothetical protein